MQYIGLFSLNFLHNLFVFCFVSFKRFVFSSLLRLGEESRLIYSCRLGVPVGVLLLDELDLFLRVKISFACTIGASY